MDRNGFYKLLKKYPKFVLKKDMNYKQIQHALQYVAPGVKEDDFIALYDTGIIRNGKNGLAITKQALHYSFGHVCIPFQELEEVKHRQKNSATSEFIFTFDDGHSEQYEFIYPNAGELAMLILEIARDLLTEKLEQLNQLSDSVSEPEPELEPKSVPETKSESNLEAEPEPIPEKQPTAEEITAEAMKHYYAKEDDKAYPLFMKAAQMGDAKAMNMVGVMYRFGYYVEQDWEVAVEWFLKSAELEWPWAFYYLGYYYRFQKKDLEKSFAYNLKGAELGDSGCQVGVGIAYERGFGTEANCEKAFYWYQKAAAQEHPHAYYYMGFLYRNGEGVAKDGVAAYECFEKAANLDHTSSQLIMGNAYRYGKDRPLDYEKSLYWYEKAAAKEDKEGLYYAGMCYKKGQGCKQDNDKAFAYLFKAAELGAKYANAELAACYMDAIGTTVNPEKARLHYEKAREEAIGYASYEHGIVEVAMKRLDWWLNQVVEPSKAPKAVEAPKPVETPKPAEAPKPVADKKLDFGWDLRRVEQNASDDKLNPINLNERSSLIKWSNMLCGEAQFEPMELYEEELLEYAARNYYNHGLYKQALQGYRYYLDRCDDLQYDLPKEVRIYLDEPGIDFAKDDKYMVHLRALAQEIATYRFAKRHPEVNLPKTEPKKEKTPEPKKTTIFRDYMVVNEELCIACGTCEIVCRKKYQAVTMNSKTGAAYIDPKRCTQCGECLGSCPMGAIS